VNNSPRTASQRQDLSVPEPRVHRAAGGGTPSDGGTDVTPSVRYDSLDEACTAEYRRLVRLLSLYSGDREAGLDLAQETCARACARWSTVSRMQDQRAWFTKVAFNLCRSRWRRQGVEHRVLALLGGRPVAVPARDVASVVTVHAALATLTPRQRAAVVLRFFADLDVGTTATVMGCSTGTVKKLTARGIATLRPLLEFDDLAGGDDA
jgi:RNA polymerase sigma factor (sigma-70 family)